jgi:hypothetical protein
MSGTLSASMLDCMCVHVVGMRVVARVVWLEGSACGMGYHMLMMNTCRTRQVVQSGKRLDVWGCRLWVDVSVLLWRNCRLTVACLCPWLNAKHVRSTCVNAGKKAVG